MCELTSEVPEEPFKEVVCVCVNFRGPRRTIEEVGLSLVYTRCGVVVLKRTVGSFLVYTRCGVKYYDKLAYIYSQHNQEIKS